MSIRLMLSELLREYSGGKGILDVNGNTVAECLQDLIRQYPLAKKWIFDSEGRLLVLITKNEESSLINQDRLNTPAKDGDELFLFMTLGGG